LRRAGALGFAVFPSLEVWKWMRPEPQTPAPIYEFLMSFMRATGMDQKTTFNSHQTG